MAKCDIIPQIQSVPSQLFENLLTFVPREEAKRIYQKIHDSDFREWFGDWIEGEGSAVVDQNGEPALVSTPDLSTERLMIDSVHLGDRTLGKGYYFQTPRPGAFQTSFVNMRNPLRPGEVDAAGVIAQVSSLTGLEINSDSIPASITRNISHQDPAVATKALVELFEHIEDQTNQLFWTGKHDMFNPWQVLGYDGILIGEPGQWSGVAFKAIDVATALQEAAEFDPIIDQKTPQYRESLGTRNDAIAKTMSSRMPGTIVIDRSLSPDAPAEVSREGDQVIIRVHPEYLASDSILHEYAHILIDGLGGLNNPQIAEGIRVLRDGDLWNEVAAKYPHLRGDALAKEVLAHAIGREADQIFTATQSGLMNRLKSWLDLFFNRVKRVFGLNRNEAKDLARQMVKKDLRSQVVTSRMPTTVQQYRAKAKENSRKIQSRRRALKDSLNRINVRVQELRRFDKEGEYKRMRELRDTLQDALEDVTNIQAMLNFVSSAYTEVTYLFDEFHSLTNEDINAKQLSRIYYSAQTYQPAKDILAAIEADSELSEKYGTEVVEQLQYISHTVNHISLQTREIGREMAVEFLFPRSKRLREKKRQEYGLEFERKFGDEYKGERKSQKRHEKAKYVDRQMQANEEQINQEIKDDLYEQLQFAQQDIGTGEMWLDAMGNVNDEILNIVAEMVDNAEHTVQQAAIRLKQQLEKRVTALREYKGNPTSERVLYEDILETANEEKDGQVTGYIVSEYSSYFDQLRKGFIKEKSPMWAKSRESYRRDMNEWRGEHMRENPAFAEWMEANKKQYTQILLKHGAEQAKKWMRKTAPAQYIPKEKYKSKQYEALEALRKENPQNPVVQFYDFVVQQQKRFDDMAPTEDTHLGFRLPSIKRTLVERVFTGDGDRWAENLKDLGRPTVNDTTLTIEDAESQGPYVEVVTDIEGKIQQYIPIHYRAELDARDKSIDVASSVLMNGFMMMNFVEKNKILADIQLVQMQIETRDVATKTGRFRNMWKGINEPHTVKGHQTNAAKLLQSFIEGRIFDIGTAQEDILFDHRKLAGTLMSYTGTLLLSGNILAGVANVAIGETLFAAEAIASHHLSLEDWRAAQGEYGARLANMDILSDIGAGRYDSELNLLMERFDALNSYNPLSHKFGDSGRARQMFKQYQLYALNNMGEHMMHTMTMLAMLNRIRITNENGEFLDSEGNVTNEKNAARFREAFTSKDGQLIRDENVKHVYWDGRFHQVNEEFMFAVTQKIRQLNEDMHGAYARQNSNHLQRFVIGRAAIMMRKWIAPGMRRRFAGVTQLLPSFEGWDGLKPVFKQHGAYEARWSQQLDAFYEGNYISFFRFMKRLAGEIKTLQFDAVGQWSEMSDMERANVKKAGVEVGMMIATALFASIMYKMAQDESDEDVANRYWYVGYQSNRLFSELMFYFNINDTYRILHNPSASLSLFQRLQRLTFQLGSPHERYETGRRKDELKIKKAAKDLIPWFNHIDRVKSMQDLVNIIYS